MPKLIFPDELTSGDFLRDFWQQRPLLIRNGIRECEFPLSPDELGGLSCEEGVESRLVIEHGATPWELRHGPFDNETFAGLPEDHWTLLVQDVDKYVPEVRELLQLFEFIPSWRIDDIMISYAEDGGSVGAHVDTYDVFLIQAMGKRRWQISTDDFTHAELIPDLSVRVLKEFSPQQEWILEPGDILYLPPGVAHWGVSMGQCMTYSVGFRAPSEQEMVADFTDYLLQHIPEHLHYLDPPLELQTNPGEIQSPIFERTRRRLAHWLDDPAMTRRWFGCFSTELKAHLVIDPPERVLNEAQFLAMLQQQQTLYRHPFARIAFATLGQDRIQLFACGQYFELPADCRELPALLCQSTVLDYQQLEPWTKTDAGIFVLLQLYNLGYLEFNNE
jgi:50S ribosomal protein L16 3-hydroxylase